MGHLRSSASPRLSVVIAAARRLDDAEPILAALSCQAESSDVELIVAGCSCNGASKILKRRHPHTAFLAFPLGTSLPTLLGRGIAQAKGDLIAVTDAMSIPGEGWMKAILAAHESPHPVIGGAVEAVEPKTGVDWAAYFCEYGQFMHPLRAGVVNELPGNNISLKRDVLKHGRQYVEGQFWKTYWCRQLQQEGIQLYSVPSIVVFDRKSYRLLPFLVRRFHHGRCFAGMRTAKASLLVKAGYAAGSAILPPLFLWRTFRAFLQKRRHVKQFLRSLPISIMAILSWSVGELCGYLLGPGRSCAHV